MEEEVDNESDQVEDNESETSKDEDFEQMDENESSLEGIESENSELHHSDNENDQEAKHKVRDDETEDINTKNQALKTKKNITSYKTMQIMVCHVVLIFMVLHL
jgi:hypothetical protein